jgi:ATP-dependent RNA helicase DDX54/DBP10
LTRYKHQKDSLRVYTMASRKRNRVIEEEDESKSDFSVVHPTSDDEFEVDISRALTGKRPRKDAPVENYPDDDDDIEELIHSSITKRNMKGGTEMLKKIKSKGKSKGDIGGGSFQNMGMCSYPMNIVR